jgi:hypothetical protein
MVLFSVENIYLMFELLTLSMAIAFWGRLRGSSIRHLPLFILAIVLFDAAALWRRSNGLPNGWINDVVIPFEFLYLMALCRGFLDRKALRMAALLPITVYLLLFVADEFFFRQSYARLYLRSYVAGVMGLLVITVLYGYELLNSDRLFRFYQEPAFWVSAGVLLFYLGTLPFHLAWNITSVNFLHAYINTKNILYFLICVMYTFFSIGILCLKPKAK